MIPTRSARVAASSMAWVVSTTVTPLARRSRTRSQTNSRAAGSSPVVGSSRNSTSGACISALATMTRWAWPPENMSGLSSARSASPNSSSSSLARRARSAAGTPW